jgi:hypothetical protein
MLVVREAALARRGGGGVPALVVAVAVADLVVAEFGVLAVVADLKLGRGGTWSASVADRFVAWTGTHVASSSSGRSTMASPTSSRC